MKTNTKEYFLVKVCLFKGLINFYRKLIYEEGIFCNGFKIVFICGISN